MSVLRKLKIFGMLGFLLLSACKENSAVDDFLGEDPNEVEVPVAIELQVSITNPASDGKKVGYMTRVSGACSPAGMAIEIRGGATGYAVCAGDLTWTADVDFSSSALGSVNVRAYMVNGTEESSPASRTFVKDNTDCDNPAVLALQYANTGLGGDGAGNPWFICNSLQLDNVRLNASDNYVLKNDVYMNSTPFSPLPQYSGEFDGNDFTISGLFVNQPSSDYSALFQRTANGANIHNLTMENPVIVGRGTVGVIAARSRSGDATFTDITVTGDSASVTATTNGGAAGVVGYIENTANTMIFNNIDIEIELNAPSHAGGVVGYTHGGYVGALTISNATVDVESNTASGSAGGIAGLLDGTNNTLLNLTSNFTAINSTGGNYIGGVIGRMDGGTLNTCTATTTITAAGGRIGGAIGQFSGTTFNNCDVTATIVVDNDTATSDYVGGLVGNVDNVNSDFDDSDAVVSITSTGAGVARYYGGLFGHFTGGSINNCHARGVDASTPGVVDITSGDGVTTGGQYAGGIAGRFYTNDNNTLNIDNVTADVDVTFVTSQRDVRTGGFVGYMYTSDPGGASNAATINVTNSYATGDVVGSNYYTGGFAGQIYSGRSGSSINITDAYATGDVTANEVGSRSVTYVGGFIGYASTRNSGGDGQDAPGGNHLLRVNATGDISTQGSNTGGLIGYIRSGRTSAGGSTSTITDAYYTGDITLTPATNANNNIGGFIGYLRSAIDSSILITTSAPNLNYANGSFVGSGNNYVGGMIGQAYAEQTSAITIDDFSTNFSASGNSYVAGLIAYLRSRRSVTNINDVQATGNVSGTTYVGGLIGYANASEGGAGFFPEINLSNATAGVVGLPVTSTVTGAGNYVGGFFGRVIGNSAAISDYVNLDTYHDVTTTTGNYVGGFAGESRSYTHFDDAIAYGDVTATNASYVGGFSGGSDQQLANYNDITAYGDLNLTYSVAKSNVMIGGLIGRVRNSDITRGAALGDINITMTGAGNINSGYIGGLTGQNYTNAEITESYSVSNITFNNIVGNTYYVGGLVGYAQSNVYRSFATGDVMGGRYSGGLFGRMNNSVEDSFASGDVVGGRYTGGLIGYHNGGAGSILRTYATGSVTHNGIDGSTVDFGEIVGRCPNNDREVDSYFHNVTSIVDPTTTPHATCNGVANGVASMLQADQANLVNFDFTNATGSTNDDWGYTTTWQVPGSGVVYPHPLPQWFVDLNP